MKRIAIATVGIVASLATLSSATQIQARGLPVIYTAAEVEADSVNRIAAQVEANVWAELREYLQEYASADS